MGYIKGATKFLLCQILQGKVIEYFCYKLRTKLLCLVWKGLPLYNIDEWCWSNACM